MIGPETLAAAANLLHTLRARKLSVVTAESCTGGLVAAALTHHPGSSTSVLGGFVTYSNAMKHALLDVEIRLFDEVGAVSREVADAMASGALERSGADLAVSITGIAGPGGASPSKPVGLVWFGIARRDGVVGTTSRVFPGDRAAIREASVNLALALLDEAASSG